MKTYQVEVVNLIQHKILITKFTWKKGNGLAGNLKGQSGFRDQISVSGQLLTYPSPYSTTVN